MKFCFLVALTTVLATLAASKAYLLISCLPLSYEYPLKKLLKKKRKKSFTAFFPDARKYRALSRKLIEESIQERIRTEIRTNSGLLVRMWTLLDKN